TRSGNRTPRRRRERRPLASRPWPPRPPPGGPRTSRGRPRDPAKGRPAPVPCPVAPGSRTAFLDLWRMGGIVMIVRRPSELPLDRQVLNRRRLPAVASDRADEQVHELG